MDGPEATASREAPEPDLELMILSGEEVRSFALPAHGEITIGRGEQSLLRIDDPSVSRNHAILRVGKTLAIEDLGSANGTVVRSKAGGGSQSAETLNLRHLVQREAPLSVGDCVVFGTTSVVIRHRPVAAVLDLAETRTGVVVRDPAMRLVYEHASLAARSLLNVLIFGETGVGKELLAHAIHAHSRRAAGPFVSVNCAALTESLVESELFGYEKGAFTGAYQARAGLFEAASGGTVFLDEVGELAAGVQAKLLRAMEQRTVTRLGSNRERPIDVRFVAATNLELEAASVDGRFRQDLFFRLNGFSLSVPPLRERLQEIEPLAGIFVTTACRDVERSEPPVLSASVLEILCRHRWPGNVRELRNAIGRAVALCIGDVLLPEHLPPSILKAVETRHAPPAPEAPPGPVSSRGNGVATLSEAKDVLEKRRIVEALDQFAGNQTRAARFLGISRGTLLARIDAFGIPRPRRNDD
ncbi:MAG TPA: sigma 54-interacting transcriptional regulator [Polyangia bacterium]|nr:sigma 54-interacting transcriptional regulator [Polyangia bacterium]